MNKDAAAAAVHRLTSRSLRNMARSRTWPTNMPELPLNATESDKEKLRKEMLALADKLDKRYVEKEPL